MRAKASRAGCKSLTSAIATQYSQSNFAHSVEKMGIMPRLRSPYVSGHLPAGRKFPQDGRQLELLSKTSPNHVGICSGDLRRATIGQSLRPLARVCSSCDEGEGHKTDWSEHCGLCTSCGRCLSWRSTPHAAGLRRSKRNDMIGG